MRIWRRFLAIFTVMVMLVPMAAVSEEAAGIVAGSFEDAAQAVEAELGANGAQAKAGDAPEASFYEETVDPSAKSSTPFAMRVNDTLRLRVDGASGAVWKPAKTGVMDASAGSDAQGPYTDFVAKKAVKKMKLTATLTGHAKKKATFTVAISDPYEPTRIDFNDAMPASVPMGTSLDLNDRITLTPSWAVSGLTWKCSGAGKVTKAGVLTTTKAGTARITVTSTVNKKVKASYNLTVLSNKVTNMNAAPDWDDYEEIEEGWTLWPLSIEAAKNNVLKCQFYVLNATGEKCSQITNLTMTVAAGTPGNVIASGSFAKVSAPVNDMGFKVIKLSLPVTGSMEGVFLPEAAAADRLYFNLNADSVTLRSKNDAYDFIPTQFPARSRVQSISLDQAEMTLQVGRTGQLTATVLPTDADKRAIAWMSDDEDVAEVADGLVTAVGVGTTTVFAFAADGGGAWAACRVTVTGFAPTPTPTPTPTPIPETLPTITSVSISPALLASGDTARITVETQFDTNYIAIFDSGDNWLESWHWNGIDVHWTGDRHSNTATWEFSYAFTGSPGAYAYSFRASLDDIEYGAARSASIQIDSTTPTPTPTPSPTPTPTTPPGTDTRYRALLIGEVDFSPVCKRNGGDVTLMTNMLQSVTGPAGGSYEITTAYNLNKTGVLNAISQAFDGADGDDVSLFFIATHGDSVNTGEDGGALALIGSTYDESWLLMGELADALKAVPGRVIVIVEACGSGAGVWISDAEQNGAVPKAAKEAADAFDAAVIRAFSKADPGVPAAGDGILANTGELRVENKFYVLAAARYLELSWGTETGPYNFFTRWLTNGIGTYGSMPADANGNGVATLHELFSYISAVGDNYQFENEGRIYYQHVQVYPKNSGYELFKR